MERIKFSKENDSSVTTKTAYIPVGRKDCETTRKGYPSLVVTSCAVLTVHLSSTELREKSLHLSFYSRVLILESINSTRTVPKNIRVHIN